MFKPALHILGLALATLSCAPALAGRPLATDDAGTTEAGTCQVESWLERRSGDGAWVVAPACGLAKGLEIGADYTLPKAHDVLRGAAGVALKWAPEGWKLDTAVGELNFGLKLGAAFAKPSGSDWQRTELGMLGLASLQPAKDWTVHANLGTAHDRASRTTASLVNLALAWTLSEQGLLFLETQANSKRAVFGGTVNTAGGRWWLVKDRFGLDLTASRQAGAAIGTLWTLGFGWYGLAF